MFNMNYFSWIPFRKRKKTISFGKLKSPSLFDFIRINIYFMKCLAKICMIFHLEFLDLRASKECVRLYWIRIVSILKSFDPLFHNRIKHCYFIWNKEPCNFTTCSLKFLLRIKHTHFPNHLNALMTANEMHPIIATVHKATARQTTVPN